MRRSPSISAVKNSTSGSARSTPSASRFTGTIAIVGGVSPSPGQPEQIMQNEARSRNVEPRLSLFLPVLNEEENLGELHERIISAMEPLGQSFEVIYVDDGSTDRSLELLKRFAEGDARVRVISFRRNYGQTAAMAAGINASRGDVLIPMDADLQNDPADIEWLLAKLEEGYDVVSGWRKDRKDALLTRTLPSKLD